VKVIIIIIIIIVVVIGGILSEWVIARVSFVRRLSRGCLSGDLSGSAQVIGGVTVA